MKGEEYNERLTAWMLTVLTHPRGVHTGANTEAAKTLLSNTIEEVIKPSTRLSSVERLSIYQRAYYARLLECFSAEYPALKHLLGEDVFRAFIVEYLQYHPSRSYTLNQLSAQFPSYLAQTQPASNAAESGGSWVNLILELADLERSYTEVYDGPGHEKEKLPNADHILKVGLEPFGQLKLAPANCLRLFAFKYPVHDYLMAIRKGSLSTQPPRARSSFVALTRTNYILRFFTISELDYNLLYHIFKDFTIKEAIDQLPVELIGKPEASIIAIRSRVCTLADEGLFKYIGFE